MSEELDVDIDSLASKILRAVKPIKRLRRKRKIIVRKQRWHLSSSFREDGDDRKFYDGAFKLNTADCDTNLTADDRSEYFLAGTSINDHYISKIIDQRTKSDLDTFHTKEDFVCTSKEWFNYVRSLDDKWQLIEFGDQAGMAVNQKEIGFIDFSVASNSVTVKIYGSEDFNKKVYDDLSLKFTVAPCHIEWIYSGDGSSINIPLLGEKLPVSEMYPFLKGETVEEYYERYLNSSASILLLIGPPGTGKTTFIRGLLHYAAKNAIVTYDEKLLEKDYIFARFIEDDVGVMVMEDADNFLKSRKEGNTMMHRFLNVGDGLITVRGKKLVFSTNLPSINDVDPALTRPGRCFDILHFENYTREQAEILANKFGVPLEGKKRDKYSLAEIFHEQRTTMKKIEARMGFI